MPRSQFDRQLTVASPPGEIWGVLTDVNRVAGWVEIVRDAKEIEPLARYTAILEDRMGPFRLRADLDVRASEVRPDEHITLKASGEDRQVASRLVAEATMDIAPGPDGTTSVQVSGFYEVTGKVAALGSGSISKKAQKILDNFFQHAAEALGAQ